MYPNAIELAKRGNQTFFLNPPRGEFKIGGIPEVVYEGEGILIESSKKECWADAMNQSLSHPFLFNNSAKFSSDKIGKAYYKVLLSLLKDEF